MKQQGYALNLASTIMNGRRKKYNLFEKFLPMEDIFSGPGKIALQI
jgi:hypothetical protein